MFAQIIAERISASLAAGELPLKPEHPVFRQGLTIGDLLLDYKEVFGDELPAEDHEGFSFGWGGQIRQPCFQPVPRKSVRPLLPPRLITPPTQRVHVGLFDSVKGVWEFYQQQGWADESLLKRSLSDKNLSAFAAKLESHLWGWHPLSLPLEHMMGEFRFSELPGFYLMLPSESFDNPWAGAVEAFLSGASGIDWLMRHYYGDAAETWSPFPEKDKELIDKVGFEKLGQCYIDFKGKTDYPLGKLQKWGDMYEEFFKKYPQIKDLDPPLIAADEWPEIHITSAEDITAAIEYAELFYEIMNMMPHPQEMEENDLGITETFAHELCDVWRRKHRIHRIEWISPRAREVSHGKAA